MKVILLEDVRKQGKKGQVIEVSDGYGRNYLIKNGLAKEADAAALNQLKSKQKAQKRIAAEELAEAKDLAQRIDQEDVVVTLEAKVGEGGRLFGAIPSKQVAEALEAQHGIQVDRRKIQMDDNITSLGKFHVPIRLHPDVQATIKVSVEEAD